MTITTAQSAFWDSFTPFQNKNFRTYLLGHAISVSGTFMQQMALQWFVWEITQDTRWIGIIGALSLAPTFFLMPFSGSLADRVDRRKLLFAISAFGMLLAVGMALLIMLGIRQVWPVAVFATLLGVMAAFDGPTRGAFIGDLSGMGEIRKAMMLYALAIETGRFIGPALAGLVVGYFNTETAFMLNGLSFVAVLISLFFVRAEQVRRPPQGNLVQNFVEAVQFVRTQRRIRDLLVCSISIMIFVFASLQLAAPIADLVLNSGPELVGYLLGASGAGAVLGILVVAPQFQQAKQPGAALSFALLWSGLWLFLTSLFTESWLVLTGIFLFSISIPVVLAGVAALIQLLAPEDMRARLMSVSQMFSMGMQPVGVLAVGWAASYLGPMGAIRVNGILMMGVAVGLLLFNRGFREWQIERS